jgi:rhodanese-related sulfurtransferase
MASIKNISKLGFIALALFIVFATQTRASEFSMISNNQLKLMLDSPNVLVIDVRNTEDWRSSNVKIKGAVRKAPQSFESWSRELPKDKALVLY